MAVKSESVGPGGGMNAAVSVCAQEDALEPSSLTSRVLAELGSQALALPKYSCDAPRGGVSSR